MKRLLQSNNREEYSELFAHDVVFQVLKAAVLPFIVNTVGLRLSVEEVFSNMYYAVDTVRRERGSDFFSAAVLLDDIASDLRNESTEEFGGLRGASEADISNAVAIIGACASVALSTSIDFRAAAGELDEELRKRAPGIYNNVSDKLFRVLLEHDRKGGFTKAMEEYIASGEYRGAALLDPDAPMKRKITRQTLAGHKEKAHQLLRPLKEEDKKHRIALTPTDYNRLLKAVDNLIEKGEPKKFNEGEKITANTTQKAIRSVFFQLFSENIGEFQRQIWGEFIKETFSNFANTKAETIAKNLSR